MARKRNPRGDDRLRELERQAAAGDAAAYLALLHERVRRMEPDEIEEQREVLRDDLYSLDESLIGSNGEYDQVYFRMLTPVWHDAGWPEHRFAAAVRRVFESGEDLIDVDAYRRRTGFLAAETQIDNASSEQILSYMDYRDRVIGGDDGLRNSPHLWPEPRENPRRKPRRRGR